MYKFTITYTINQPVPCGSQLKTRTAIVYGKTISEGQDKVRALDESYVCSHEIVSEEILTENKRK